MSFLALQRKCLLTSGLEQGPGVTFTCYSLGIREGWDLWHEGGQ